MCTHASSGHFIIWFALSAGEGAQVRFTEKAVVFDEFLVRPDEEMLRRAYRWTLDLPQHKVRPISSALTLSVCALDISFALNFRHLLRGSDLHVAISTHCSSDRVLE